MEFFKGYIGIFRKIDFPFVFAEKDYDAPSSVIYNLYGVDHVDHSLVYVHRKISIPRKQPKIINTRQFKHYNIEAYKQDLAKVLQNQPQDCDPNTCTLWKEWKEKFY